MIANQYFETLHTLLDRIQSEQGASIQAAGRMIAHSWASGGRLFITDMGHGTAAEMTNRAGGLMGLKHLKAEEKDELKAGDVVFAGSVSGRNIAPIDLAIQCREKGAKVIVLTALEYTAQVTSLHESGKKLMDVGDLVIDLCAPFGDASQEIEGLPVKALPVSGIAFIAILWAICGEAIEQALAKGIRPHVYMSHNRPGGPEFNERELAECAEIGF
jgi:uncharacterized phosphosugar-binding protein